MSLSKKKIQQYRERVADELRSNPYWKVTALNKFWICPYTGDVGAKVGKIEDMVDEVMMHLMKTPQWREFEGLIISFQQLKKSARMIEVKHRIETEPNWSFTDKQGRWYCPYTARATPIALTEAEKKEVSKPTLSKMVDYLETVDAYKKGEDAKPYSYIRARHEFITNPAWKVFTDQSQWVCPYCASVTSVSAVNEGPAGGQLFDNITGHLHRCVSYQDGTGEVKTTDYLLNLLSLNRKIEKLIPKIVQRMHNFEEWRISTVDGHWVCPYCGIEIREIALPTDRTKWHIIAKPIARHLLTVCGALRESTAAAATAEEVEGALNKTRTRSFSREAVQQAVSAAAAKKEPTGPAEAVDPEANIKTHADLATPKKTAVWGPEDSVYQTAKGDAAPITAQPNPIEQNKFMAEMQEQLRAMKAKMAESEDFSRSLEEARRKQMQMLPELPNIPNYDFEAVYQPCDMVGGDFYDFVRVEPTKLGIVVGDVSGHGLDAAMVMSMAKKILSMQLKLHKDPGAALKEANAELIPDLDSKTFVSVFLGILDTDERTLTFVRGGHNPLIHFNPMRSPRLVQYEPPGMVLGMAKPEIFNRVLKVETIQLAPGDVLFQYTDGVTEANNEAKEEFSVERLCELIEKHGQKEMEYLLFQVNKALAEFRGRAKMDDDVTMLGIKII